MPEVWAEPLSVLFWRIRVQTYFLVAAFVSVVILAGVVLKLVSQRSALVYVIEPNGQVHAIREWLHNTTPTQHEASYVASTFVQLLYGRNSSTVHTDLAQAIAMCSTSMQTTLRDELAAMDFIGKVREQNIRSETVVASTQIQEQSHTHFVVNVTGETRLYPLMQYDGEPAEKRRFNIRVGLRVVEREPTTRRNGLEIVSLSEAAP